jgi:hypothetical protein
VAPAPSWEPIPEGVKVADGVDLGAEDPALLDTPQGRRRICVAWSKRTGARCKAPPALDALICNAHAGKLDARAGALALAELRRTRRDEAEDRVAERRLGVRAALSAQLQREQEKVERAVQHLLDVAAAGDTKAAMALLPWIDQALGKPTERREITPSSAQALSQMSEDELAALVAEGRRRKALRSA